MAPVRSPISEAGQTLHCSITTFGSPMDKQTRHLPTLDGWRGLAVLGVILLHGRFFTTHWLQRVSIHGGSGVAVFFAISGFLICHLLLEEHDRAGSIDCARFYLRRCLRIMPAYYVALLGIGLISILGAIQLNGYEIPSCLLFYRSYMPMGMEESSGYYTAHYWSLAVEAHFYLICPLIVAYLPRHRAKVMFSLAMAVLFWRWLKPGFMGDTRMDGLFWGCLAAIYFDPLRRMVERIPFTQLWLPIGVLALSMMRLPLRPDWEVGIEAVLFPTLILSTVLQPRSWLSRALEWKPVAWTGTISYSLYLWQQIFLPPLIPAEGPFHSLQRSPWNVLAIFLLATMSFYLIEMPMIHWGHRVIRSPSLIRSGRSQDNHLPVSGDRISLEPVDAGVITDHLGVDPHGLLREG
jgi:peptidoglycan/LPS O-acetylase OafA/YrhL